MTPLHEPDAATTPRAATTPVARRHFLSWVRDGVAGSVTEPDPGSGPLPARAELSTGLTVNGVAVTGPDLALHGPGDVIGIDPRQVVRLEPPDRTTDFEPEHLAAIEFDDPALPWRFTPAAPHPEHGLRPWLVLVVLDLSVAGVGIEQPTGGPLPVLTAPVAELPDLAESAAWAHAEVTAVDGEDVGVLLRTRPERTVSRLLAPRALRAGRRYLACLVPAFTHGVAAGLGVEPQGDTTGPAWSGTTGSVSLPVYHSWSFATGPDGDFPTLAGRLRAVVPDPGRRTLSYRHADPDLTGALGDDPGIATVLPALHPANATPDEPASQSWSQALQDVLRRGGTEHIPPIYLAGHVDHGPAWAGWEPAWQTELNTDPRLRAAAGLGARVVRENQEALMSAAWRQAADLARANRELARGTLGRAIGESLHRRHFDPAQGASARTAAATAGGSGVVVTRSAAALSRIATFGANLLPGGRGLAAAEGDSPHDLLSSGLPVTVAGALGAHPATAGVVTPSVQRALRPTGPAAKAAGATAQAPLGTPVLPVAAGDLVPAPQLRAAGDTGVLDRVPDTGVHYRGITAELVDAARPWWRAWATSTPADRPAFTPGLHGYLADLLILDQAAPGAPVTVTVRGEMDFDGTFGPAGAPFQVPSPAGAPAGLTLLGASLVRDGRDADPALVLSYADGPEQYAERRHYLRWVKGVTATGYREAGGLRPVGSAPFESYDVADVTDLPVPDPENPVQQIGLTWVDRLQTSLETMYAPLDPQPGEQTGDWWYDRKSITLPPLWDDEQSAGHTAYAFDWIPKPFTGSYTRPTDLVVAWLAHTPEWYGSEFPSWSLQYCVVRGADGWNPEVGPMLDAGVVCGRVDSEHATRAPRLSLTVTDLDGNGKLEVIAHVTAPEAVQVTIPGPITEGAWSVFPFLVGQLDPDTGQTSGPGGQVDWSVPATPNSIVVVGDTSERRLTRLAAIGDRFQQAAAVHQGRLVRPETEPAPPPGAAPYSMAAVAAEVATSLDPAVTVPQRVLERVRFGGATPQGPAALAAGGPDPLRPRWFEPTFDQPMVEPLRELFTELVLPAADAVPTDGVALMTGNAPLIAAYLAGLNDEFGRELLWRGFPSSGRATWFRRFFDARGAAGGADILDIANWGDRDLASVVTGAGGRNRVSLLVRSPLVRRFPNIVVQAVRAVWVEGRRAPGSEVVPPSFTGSLGPDLALFGFPLTAAALRGSTPDEDEAGYFLCFAEPPTQSRFAGAGAQSWDRPGAHAATALLALPHRVLIHASDLLDPTTGDAA